MADDADLSIPLSEGQRKARKPHKCFECGRVITIAETYMFATYIDQSRAKTYKTCAHCHVAMQWLGDNCGGWIYGHVWQDIDEHVEEYRGVYPKVARALKRLCVWQAHDWRIVYGPGAGQMVRVPAMPAVVE